MSDDSSATLLAMPRYCSMFGTRKGGETSGSQTVVCVKRVKQEVPDGWDETMPLPGDIIEGVAEDDDAESLILPARARAEFSSLLKKLSQSSDSEVVWLKVRRGENTIKLRARIVPEKSGMLHRKFTIGADTDGRHIAVLGDLNLEECIELQEMSRRVVNIDGGGYNKKGTKYNWKMKLAAYLPDPRAPVISSILLMPLAGEHSVEAATSRSMAWFSAAITSGVPLVFVNIQTEPTSTPVKLYATAKEGMKSHIVKGIRLWFLPGIAEVSFEIVPEVGETRFGMDIKRTEEGFICVYSVALGSAADRAGLRQMHEEANEMGYLLVMSRLEGRSLMPSNVCSSGLIHCCDQSEIRQVLTTAIDRMEGIQVHVMAWPNRTRLSSPHVISATTLRPPQ